jgi:alkylation response protein AidB-like acyl-CoA dehydrogenase
MDLRETSGEAAFRAGLRAWLSTSERTDAREWLAALHGAGYAGLTWPEEYGGRGLTVAHQVIFLEETARAGLSEHIGVIGLGMVGPTIIAHGTDEQRRRHLPAILSGRTVFCQGFSEPDAGSDLAAVRTRALPDGDSLVVTGEKVWSSYATSADRCLLLARSGPPDARHRGLTCLVVDLRAPGVTVEPIRQMTGEDGFGRIRLDGVRVPRDEVIGEVGDGWRVAMATLAHERGTFGFTLTARLERQFGRLVDTVRDAGAADDPLVRDRLAALRTDLLGLRWTNHRLLGAGTPGAETSIVKLAWSRCHQSLTALAVDVLAGGARTAATAEWARVWTREALRGRANTIEGGTTEVLRDIVAERVLMLPRAR